MNQRDVKRIPLWFAVGGTSLRAAASGLLVLLGMLASAGAASAAAVPPTVASSFIPSSIGAGGTSALAVTVTNPNASTSLSGIGFADTLPPGLVVDTPNGQSGTCGSAGVLSAVSGSNTITLTGGKLAGGATCTVSVAVTASAAGSYVNSTGPVSSTEGGAGAGDTETLSVIGPPTIAISSPREGQVFSFGQDVKARYSCLEAPGGPGVTDCSGDAGSGSPIDTSVAGPQTFTVTAVSDDGQVTTQTVDYTVLPDNRFVVRSITAKRGGIIVLDLRLPGPGRVQVLETAPRANLAAALTIGAGRFSFGQVTRAVHASGRLKLTIAPSARGRRLVANHRHAVTVRVAIAYTPTGGKTRIRTIGALRIPG